MSVLNVLIVNPILYHYRREVFRALDKDERLRVAFASDLGGVDGIVPMPPHELQQHIRLKVRRGRVLEWQSGLIGHLFRNRYDAVILLGNAKYVSTWIAALIGRMRGMRVFFWTIGWHRPEHGIKRLFRLGFYRLAHELLLYGKTARSIGIDAGYPAARMRVIGNSVVPSVAALDRDSLELPKRVQGRMYLGAVIRLTEVKRLDLLIAASAQLEEMGYGVTVVLVGEGNQSGELKRRARTLGVDLWLPGAVYSPQDLARVYEILDVTVVPAAVGLTAIQSLGYGTPVVSDDDKYRQMPEWEAIIAGVTGELYTAGDVDSLVDAILRAYNRQLDAPVQVSADCRAEVRENWSAMAQAEKIVSALREQTR